MSDIRFNQWLHNSGTGGVSQVDGGHVGIGTTNPLIPVGAGNTSILNVGVVTATSYYGNVGTFTGDVSVAGDFQIPDVIKHQGDINTKIRFPAADTFSVETAGSERLRITSDGDVGINVTPTNNDMAGVKPRLHVSGISTNGQFNTVARFQAGGDADSTGAMIVINHGNDRGLAIQGGRISGNYAHGALKMVDNVGRLSDAMVIHGGAGQGINDISFFTGASTTTTNRLHIKSDGKILIGSTNTSNNTRLGNELAIVGTEAYTGMSITNYPGTNAQHSPMFDFNRSRGTSDQSMTSVVAGDKLGELIFRGSNGSSFTDAVTLRSYADSVSGTTVNGRFEIGTTNGSHTAKMIVSREGYVTKPNNPAFIAGRTGGNQTFTVGTFPLNVARLNVGNHYNTSTYKFVVPVAGVYYFYGQVYYNNGNGQYRLHIRKTPNGGSAFQLNTSSHKTQNGNDTSDSLAIIESMAVGDTVELYSDSNYSIQCYYNINDATYGAHTYFMGYLIG